MEDHQIIELYFARDELAIEETAKRYGGVCMQVSMDILKDRMDAEECVSDTYLAAWNSMPEERPTYLGAFLSRIVRRISITRFRSAHAGKRGGAGRLIEELTDAIPSDCDLQAEYDNTLLAQALNRFLRSLDEEKRYVFVRRYYYSDPIGQIARALRVSEGKIKTDLFRLRGALKKFLEQEGIAL